MSRSHSRFFPIQKSIFKHSIEKYYFPPKVTNPTIAIKFHTPLSTRAPCTGNVSQITADT